jgi:hypothetical protein
VLAVAIVGAKVMTASGTGTLKRELVTDAFRT